MAKNLCLDCNSKYKKPGTCNCFAPGGKRDPNGGAGGLSWANWTLCQTCGEWHTGSHVCPSGTVSITWASRPDSRMLE